MTSRDQVAAEVARRAVPRSLVILLSVLTALSMLGTVALGSIYLASRGDVSALSQQVQSLGGTPVAGPAGQRGDTGQTGQAGQEGPSGAQGPTGPAGATGPAGRDGATAPCVTSPTACVGPTGPAGSAGQNGTNGRDGQDGTTPPCMSEPAQCRGSDGRPPASWVTTRSDGSQETCTRDPSSPDSAPTYSCSVTRPPITTTPTTTTTDPGLPIP